MANPDHVRIWQIVNGSPVRLTLHDGDTITHCIGGPTDEGWTHREESWRYLRSEGVVTCFVFVDGRDCDGRLSHMTRLFAPLDQLASYKQNEDLSEAVWTPNWRLLSRDQRDYSAEAMNY